MIFTFTLLLTSTLLAEINTDNKINFSSPSFIKNIIHEITGDDTIAFLGFNPQVEVIDSNLINAFAYGDKTVILTSALLKKIENKDELAFVIAHEVAHLSLNHGASPLQDAYVEHFSHELEADKFAIDLLKESNFKGIKSISFLSKLQKNIGTSEPKSTITNLEVRKAHIFHMFQ